MSKPPKWKVQRCQKPGCGAATVWAQTPAIHRIQVDAEPSPAGTYFLEDTGHRDPVAHAVPAEAQAGYPVLHRFHYMTCTGTPVRRWERS